jgi:UDP-N-acetylmuramate--alanine ligase
VFAVVQPHRYSRLGNLMEEFQTAFNDADRVLVTPVYAAGEQPVEGVSADALVEGLKRRGHRGAAAVADADALAAELAGDLRAGDQVVCLGAGDITKWAAGLADAIAAKRAFRPQAGEALSAPLPLLGGAGGGPVTS